MSETTDTQKSITEGESGRNRSQVPNRPSLLGHKSFKSHLALDINTGVDAESSGSLDDGTAADYRYEQEQEQEQQERDQEMPSSARGGLANSSSVSMMESARRPIWLIEEEAKSSSVEQLERVRSERKLDSEDWKGEDYTESAFQKVPARDRLKTSETFRQDSTATEQSEDRPQQQQSSMSFLSGTEIQQDNSKSKQTQRSKGGSSAREDKDEATFHLQEQIRKFMSKKKKANNEQKEVEAYTRLLRGAIDKLVESRGKMGGFHAVQENEAVMERNLEILERRVQKANIDLMEERTNNERLRREVDERRKQKGSKLEAINTVSSENEMMKQRIQELEQAIRSYDTHREKVEETTDRVLEETKTELASLERQYERLQNIVDKSKFQMDLPTPPAHMDKSVYSDSDSVSSKEAKKLISKHGFGSPLQSCKSPHRRQKSTQAQQNRWSNMEGALEDIDRLNDPTLSLRQIWEQISWATGIETPEEFADKFTEGNELNYNLFRRLDYLKKEAEEMRSRIQQCQYEIDAREHELRVSDTEKKGAFESMQKQINQAKDKKKKQSQEIELLQRTQGELARTLKDLLETLDAPVPVSQIEGRDCRKLYSMFEYRFKQVLSAYSRFTGQIPECEGDYGETPSKQLTEHGERLSAAAPSASATKHLSDLERRQHVDLSIMNIRKGMLAAASNQYVSVKTPRNETEESEPKQESGHRSGRGDEPRSSTARDTQASNDYQGDDQLLQPSTFVVGPQTPLRQRRNSTPKPRSAFPSPNSRKELRSAEKATGIQRD